MKPKWFMQAIIPTHSYPLRLRAEVRLAKIHIFCTQETWHCAGVVHAGLPGLGERFPVLIKVRHDLWGS